MESGGTIEDDDESSCGESQSEDIESEDVTSTPNSSESQTVSQWNIFKSQSCCLLLLMLFSLSQGFRGTR